MLFRLLSKSKEKLCIALIAFTFNIIFFFIYVNQLQENYTNSLQSMSRCVSELTSVKYQLNVVTEYKNRIDKLLTESQKAHQSDKELMKEMMDSCVAMKQQSMLCQSQFEDLQGECKKVKQDYDKVVTNEGKSKIAAPS